MFDFLFSIQLVVCFALDGVHFVYGHLVLSADDHQDTLLAGADCLKKLFFG